MQHGFLGYYSTFMLDVVVCALLLVVPLLGYSLYLVKFKRRYQAHRNLQILLGAVLLVTVLLFEVDVQYMHGGWENIVAQRPVPHTPESMAFIRRVLYVHLCFALSTPVLWAITLGLALQWFPNPPIPGRHSRGHAIFGWLSTIGITLTSLTGLAWYYVAFVAA